MERAAIRAAEYHAGWQRAAVGERTVRMATNRRDAPARRARSFTTKNFFWGPSVFLPKKLPQNWYALVVGAFGCKWNNTQAYRPGTSRPARKTAAETQYRPT